MASGIINLIVGVVCIALSILLVSKKVPMNKWSGVRVLDSYESAENRHKINAYDNRLVQV